MPRLSAFFGLSLMALIWAAPSLAQVSLVRATPAQASTQAQVKMITLEFSDVLDSAASGFELVMTGMPGMEDHPPMKMQGFAVNVSDKNITATLPRALPTGSYELRWHAAGADAQAVTGTLQFNAE